MERRRKDKNNLIFFFFFLTDRMVIMVIITTVIWKGVDVDIQVGESKNGGLGVRKRRKIKIKNTVSSLKYIYRSRGIATHGRIDIISVSTGTFEMPVEVMG